MAPQRAGRDITKQMLRHRQMVLDQMDFKQKAEEKKMSMSKNIARLAVTAGLTAALSFGGVMAPVTMAFAEGGTGSITINQAKDNENTTFKAYQIFKATVTDTTSGKTAQDITWADPNLGTKVVNAIKTNWAGYNDLAEKEKLPDTPTAQEVADFLMAHAENPTASSADGKTKGTRVATDNVLYAVANVVKDETPTAPNITAGQPWSATAGPGYYLFLTNESTLGSDQAAKKNTGTSPIFAVVGGNAVTVTEKTSIPTVGKQILASAPNDPTSATDWAGVADSQIGQEVTYKLTGSVADNYASYDSYAYKFTDTLSMGLTYTDNSVVVYAVNKGSSNQDKYELIANNNYTTNTANNDDGTTTLTIEFGAKGEKKGLKDIPSVNADTQIVVFYKAKLNKNAVTGNGVSEGKKGNYNSVKLEYSNNPYGEGTGTSVEGGAGDFTFQLNINKVDQGTEKGLGGAVFTIKSDNNKYVASKDGNGFVAGELVDVTENSDLPEYVKFTSTDEGKIAAKGLDAGTYTVTEIKAPNDKYTAAQPFTFTISAQYKSNAAEIENITVSPSQNDKYRSDVALGTLDNTPGDSKLTVENGTAANSTTGEINITVGNTKSVGLPLTGLNGVTFTWIAGGAVLCIGVAHLIRSRKQAEESEQE